jgi:hypothetical protein
MSFRLATWFQVIEFWSAAEWSNCNVSVSLASKLARAFALNVFDWLDNRSALTLLGNTPGETDVAVTARRPNLGPRTPRRHLQSVNYAPVELVHREAWDIAS